MKKILITGKDSYIGTSVEQYLSQFPDKYQISFLDIRGGLDRGKFQRLRCRLSRSRDYPCGYGSRFGRREGTVLQG